MTRYDPDTNDPTYGATIPDGPTPAGTCADCGCRLFPLPGEDPEDVPDKCEDCEDLV